ncbi:MAG: hypothetical protein M3O46_07730 [Myxococcota bacterium]|nr:hypothetical protein [Myxococcota bacterium]
MRVQRLGQWIGRLAASAALGVAVISCGGGGTSLFTAKPSVDGSVGGGDDGAGNPAPSDDASLIVTGDGAAMVCTPKTCQSQSLDCGPNSDGCGGLLDCGTCPAGQTCGGGGFSVCGVSGSMADGSTNDAAAIACVPTTCQSTGYTCGKNGDGCGGILDCGACSLPETCGGGGFSKCGSFASRFDAGSSCVPTTCSALGYDCGPGADSCGGLLQCGSCTAPETCGAGGFSKCGLPAGVSPDGGRTVSCTPSTCAAFGFTCGPAADGCGGLLQCGTCAAPQTCGAGGFSKCGLPPGVAPDGGSTISCTPKTCSALGYDCGPASDGCGALLQCGTCTSPQTCGGGGFNKCGAPSGASPDGASACTPTTCASQGITCGPTGDGCGNLLSCGTCNAPQSCGGGSVPGQCGCQGLCQQLVACDGGTKATVTGTVRAGLSAWTNRPADPVPNVLVYVPNTGTSSLQPFAPGAACRQCGADVSGNPLVSTYSDFDGTFTLANVPSGSSIPIVIQLGRWRRSFTVNVPACATTALGDLNLPRNKTEGDIPLTAVSTGSADPLECVLLKMGVDQAEFTPDSGSGRIHVYGGGPNGPNGGVPGVTAGAGTRTESVLMDTGGTYMNYDQVLLPCWGHAANKTAAELLNLISYADGGGHFFATHYSYSWLVNNGEFNGVAHWHPDYDNPGNVNWTQNVSVAVPPSPPAAIGGAFAKWLNLVGALSNAGTPMPAQPQVLINNPRHDADFVVGPTLDWIDGTDPDHRNAMVEHFTFNTPVTGSQCGHAIFSDFHVSQIAGGKSSTKGMAFPDECTKTFNAQEKILEYMLFDLASCAGPLTPTCNPLTCQQQNVTCGPAGDGCGGQLACGTCTPPLTCGGGGVAGQCGAPDGGSCQPESCQQQSLSCGQAGDGCGNVLNCGTCTSPAACVGGQCIAPDAASCQPTSCQQQQLMCGQAGDGCGNVLNCGACTAPATCVGGKCIVPDAGPGCVPASCSQQQLMCGQAGDGCGNVLDCGTCPAASACIAGNCVASDAGCPAATCAQQNLSCGLAGDGCGNVIDCGACAAPAMCVAGQCATIDSGGCVPLTCQQENINCGYSGDGCGNLLDCGTCVAPATCGGNGVPGQCGAIAQ